MPERALELSQNFRVVPKWGKGTVAVPSPVPGYGLLLGSRSDFGWANSLQPRVIPRQGCSYGSRGWMLGEKGTRRNGSSVHYSPTFGSLRSTYLYLIQKEVLQYSDCSHFLEIYRQRICGTNHTSYCYSWSWSHNWYSPSPYSVTILNSPHLGWHYSKSGGVSQIIIPEGWATGYYALIRT